MKTADLEEWKFEDERLLELVLENKKTATAYLFDGNLPKVGEKSIILNKNGEKSCLVQTKEVYVLKFCDMTWDLAKKEGEFHTLNDWRREHIKFFSRKQDFSEDSLIVFEIFELVEKF